MTITIPDVSLVLLVGPSGSGKSTFARKHFQPSEVISSDYCRHLVADDESDQSATSDAFEIVHLIAAKRLARGRLTVIDATNIQPESRRPLLFLACRCHVSPIAIVLNLAESACLYYNQQRPGRVVGSDVIRHQWQDMQRSLPGLEAEGFRCIYVLNSGDQIDAAVIERRPVVSGI